MPWRCFRFVGVTIVAATLISMCVALFSPAHEDLKGTASLLFGLGVWFLAMVIAFFDELHRHTKKSETKEDLGTPVQRDFTTDKKDKGSSKNGGKSTE